MRERTREYDEITHDGEGVLTSITRVHGSDPEVTINEYPYSGVVKEGGEVMHDVVTPNWKRLMSSGAIINNPMDLTKTIHSEGHIIRDLTWFWRHTSHQAHYENRFDGQYVGNLEAMTSWPAFLPLDSIDTEVAKNLAVQKAWAKVSAAPWQALVSAAELHKTWRDIRQLFFLIVRVIDRVRRGRRAVLNGTMAVSKMASLWLSYRYGIRPLFYEITSAIDAVKSIGKQKRVSFRSTVVDKASGEDSIEFSTGNGDNTTDWTVLRASARNVRASAGVLVEPRIRSASPTNNVWQSFGIDELLPSIWELVPYSFIIDWLWNTADYIASWSPKVDVVPLTSWVVLRDDCRQSNLVSSHVVNGVWVDIGNGYVPDETKGPPITLLMNSEPNYEETRTTVRTPLPDRPLIPSLNIRLDVSKMIDVLALMQGLVQGRGRGWTEALR